jgi:hypothetical protein
MSQTEVPGRGIRDDLIEALAHCGEAELVELLFE